MIWFVGWVFLIAGICGTTVKAQSGHAELERVINQLRRLYQDSHSTIENIKILRDSDQTERARELAQELEEELSSRLDELRGTVDDIQTERRSLRRKVTKVQKVMNYFARYLQKFLSNWQPENPKLLEAFNRKQLIAREIASPEMLRKQFLTDLTSLLHSKSYVREDVVAQELNRTAGLVQSKYKEVLDTFLGLLSRIEKARNDENQEVEQVVQQVEQEWQTFWTEFKQQQSDIRQAINRFLILYRGRERLPSDQKILYKRGLRVKRQFNDIMEFRKSVSVDNLFTNRKAIHDLLVMMGRRYSNRLLSLLSEHTEPYMFLVDSFDQARSRLEEIETEEAYRTERERIDRWVEDVVVGSLEIESALERIKGVPVRQMTGLIGRLRTYYGDKEQKLGDYLAELRTYTLDFYEFAERARKLPEDYVERFKEVSFSSRDQFQRVFPGPLAEKVNSLNEKQQELEIRLGELEQQFEKVVKNHFSKQSKSDRQRQ